MCILRASALGRVSCNAECKLQRCAVAEVAVQRAALLPHNDMLVTSQ